MSTWNNTDKLAGAPSTTYNDATVTYNSSLYNYIGQILSRWFNFTKN